MNTIPLTNIFGESMPPKLILEEPPSETKESMANMLIGRCNKQLLLRYAETFSPWLSQYSDVLLKTKDGKTRQATEITLMVKSSTSKNDMALGVATMLASQQNMLDYIDSLSEEMKTLWRTLLLKNYLSHATAKKILKTKDNLFSEQRSYYYYSSGEIVWNKRELGWFYTTYHYSAEKDKYGYREKQNYITLSNTVRGIFFPLFFQQMLIEGSHTTAELPKGKWHTVELEADSQSHFKLLSSLIKQGEFTMRKNGITQADVKRVNKKLSIKDFFDPRLSRGTGESGWVEIELLVEGGVDVVAGEAKGDSGVDVAVHVIALETELVQFGTKEVEIGVIGGQFQGGTDVFLGIVETFHG